MSTVWFTSDLHLNHAKAVEFDQRKGLFTSLWDMNETIIKAHNERVNWDDIVYVLGDVCLGDPRHSVNLVRRLNGQKTLIAGNHDTDAKLEAYREARVFENILWADRFKWERKHFYLSHYPTLVENHTKNPLWVLHGHTHSTSMFSDVEQNFNIGWEAHHRPISIEEIINLLPSPIF